jgi:hypothetical protein
MNPSGTWSGPSTDFFDAVTLLRRKPFEPGGA